MVKGLFIGAKVRIIWSTGWPELSGEVGIIIGRSATKGVNGVSEWIVCPDIWGSPYAPRKGNNGATRFGPCSAQLEPILPEGAQPLGYSFEQMMSEFGVMEAVK
ncbi:MAG: hypothetical protein [Bacteriophage sp.]|nr:MAG: hypothetical protein [Bacteriophage sp.]